MEKYLYRDYIEFCCKMRIVDYTKGKIYKVCHKTDTTTKVYVGSTVRPLEVRFRRHCADYRRRAKARCCSTTDMFDEFGMENCKIELLEEFPCADKDSLVAREMEFMKQIGFDNLYNKKTIPNPKYLAMWQKNKTKYLQSRQNTFVCDCDKTKMIKVADKHDHFRTDKHKRWLEAQNKINTDTDQIVSK